MTAPYEKMTEQFTSVFGVGAIGLGHCGVGGGFSGVGGGGSTSAAVPQLPQQQEQVQSLSIIGSESLKRELEEFAAADGVIPARTMLRYLNSVEGARRIGS